MGNLVIVLTPNQLPDGSGDSPALATHDVTASTALVKTKQVPLLLHQRVEYVYE
jgi:hypothetical protein